jgi:hypothetical protein
VGKGTLVREVDALDGLIGRIAGKHAYLEFYNFYPLFSGGRQGGMSISDIEQVKRCCCVGE